MDADVIVVGTGAMGSSAAEALAGHGLRVLALDLFPPAHARGSSHGRTRIVRQAYFESPAYLPLLRRAYALWETFPPRCTLQRVGCLMVGGAASPVVIGAARSAAAWGVPVEELTGDEVHRRFPAFRPAADDVAVFEPDAGYVRPEETVAFLTERGRERGVQRRSGVRVTGWDVVADGVLVRTEDQTFRAARLVLAAGAWTGSLAGPVTFPVRPERRLMHFFAAPGDQGRWAPEAMPTFIWDIASTATRAGDSIYGFPDDGTEGVKIGFHNRGGPADPDVPPPPATAAEVAEIQTALAERLPGVAGSPLRTVGCLYELTPDHDFLLGLVPGCDERVVVAAGFSGHGFKFVPVVGEVVADLVTSGGTAFDLVFLSPARFLDAGPPQPAVGG